MPAKKKKIEGEPKRVVFYIRFSSWHQDAENSKEGQLNALQAYADANGLIHVGTYIDEGISGKRDDRPELNRMMRDARSRNRPFDEVLIWKVDRLGRRASTIDRRATELEDLGIAVTAVQQPIEGKPSVVRFVRNMMANMAEFFSDNMGEDIARGRRTSANHGVWTTSSVPFGLMKEYRMNRGRMRPFLIPDPDTAWIIERLFGLYLNGSNSNKIAKTFREEAVPSSTSKPWTANGVRSKLKNIAYAGFIHFGKRSKFDDPELLAPARDMEIISLEEYNRAQEIMASHTPTKSHPREVASIHLLSGLTFCDNCNCKMSPTGGERSYYNCNDRRRGLSSCDTPNPRTDNLDAAVLQHILDRILTEQNTERIIAMVAGSQTETTLEVEEELRNVSLEIESIKESRKNLLRLVEKGEAVPGDISDNLTEIRETLTRLEANAMNASAKVSNEKSLTSNPQKVVDYAKNLKTYLRGTNLDLTKEILKELIVQVRIRPGEEKDTAIVIIRYKIPTPPKGWTKGADVEELWLRKNMRSLEYPVHPGDTPFLLLPGFEFVFLSSWRTVSRELLSANSNSTTLPASNRSVQCVCPAGAVLHTKAIRCASCWPSSLRSRPGRGLSLMADSSPSSTYRFRDLATVAALTNSTSASSRSRSPSSALSSASARLTVRTDGLPRWETALRRERSASVSATLYLMAAMAGHLLAERSYPSMAAFSYSYKSIWER